MADLGWDTEVKDPDPGGFGQGPGPSAEQWQESLTSWAATPWTPEEYQPYREQFGFGTVTGDMSPFARDKTMLTGDLNLFGAEQKGYEFPEDNPQTLITPGGMPPPSFLSKLYSFQPSRWGQPQTLQALVERARRGVKGWTSGGPDAPRILTPVEWEEMLPSEKEGMLGFLEFIGIPSDDYQAMMERQASQVGKAFGISPNWRPARQR